MSDDQEINCLIALIRSSSLQKEIGFHAIAAFLSELDPEHAARTVLDLQDVSDVTVLPATDAGTELGSC